MSESEKYVPTPEEQQAGLDQMSDKQLFQSAHREDMVIGARKDGYSPEKYRDVSVELDDEGRNDIFSGTIRGKSFRLENSASGDKDTWSGEFEGVPLTPDHVQRLLLQFVQEARSFEQRQQTADDRAHQEHEAYQRAQERLQLAQEKAPEIESALKELGI